MTGAAATTGRRVPVTGAGVRPAQVWLVALVVAAAFAWPLVYAAWFHGLPVLIHSITGDGYHYLAIARKAQSAHIYTYDGVHVTNGFHPLWQYYLRYLYAALDLQSHEAQAIAMMLSALVSATLGFAMTAAAVVRMTGRRFLGALVVPGLFYMLIGAHLHTLSAWSSLDGMESAFSTLFGGLFFLVMSRHVGAAARQPTDIVAMARGLGLVMPWIILSRLDDVFLLPGFLLALWMVEGTRRDRLAAAVWVTMPSTLAVLLYMAYNHATAGSAMPLSGSTKAGFVGWLSLYLTAAVHFPPVQDFKAWATGAPSNAAVLAHNSFRFVEVAYPLLIGLFGAWSCLARRRARRIAPLTAVCLALWMYIVIKESYNFLNVHPWHQASWYYVFVTLSLSVLLGLALQPVWDVVTRAHVAGRAAVVSVYALLTMLVATQYYTTVVDEPDRAVSGPLWERHQIIRDRLEAGGVHGLINVDDGILAFLLDLPNMHGLAFATDIEAQKAYKAGRMLSLASSRGINAIAGDYMRWYRPLTTDAELREYLRSTLAFDTMRSEMDAFDFRLVYYDPVIKMPFVAFTPKVPSGAR